MSWWLVNNNPKLRQFPS